MFNKKTKIRIKNFQPLLRVKHSGLFRLNAKIKIDIFTLENRTRSTIKMFNKKTKIRIKNFQPLLRVKHSGLFRLNAKIKIDIFTLDKVITRNNSLHHNSTNGDLRSFRL